MSYPYLFTTIPGVTSDKPFIHAHGIVQISEGEKVDRPDGVQFTYCLDILCTSPPEGKEPAEERLLIDGDIHRAGKQDLYPNETFVFLSGMLKFGMTAPAVSFRALYEDVQPAKPQKETAGQLLCTFGGVVRAYPPLDKDYKDLFPAVKVALLLRDGVEFEIL